MAGVVGVVGVAACVDLLGDPVGEREAAADGGRTVLGELLVAPRGPVHAVVVGAAGRFGGSQSSIARTSTSNSSCNCPTPTRELDHRMCHLVQPILGRRCGLNALLHHRQPLLDPLYVLPISATSQ